MNQHTTRWTAALATTAALCVALAAPGSSAIAGTVKPAYVQGAIPTTPFFAVLDLTSAGKDQSAGPGTGTLAVTSITITNFDAVVQQVYIFAPLYGVGATCSSVILGGGADPQMMVFVQPKTTLHLTYPSPLVFKNVTPSCIAFRAISALTTIIEVGVSGFSN